MHTSELRYTTSRLNAQQFDVALERYPDSMPLVQHAGSPFVYRVLLRPESLGSFVAGLFWLDSIAARFNCFPHLVLPFLPGARQDRLNSSGDALFTAKSVAQLINARELPSVTVLDPHSEVMPGLLDRCRVIHAAELINPPAGKYSAVVAPDAGSEKRATAVALKLEVPLIHAWKTRSVSDGTITGFGVEPINLPEGARVLVVDDICDGGRTFLGLADAIGARFDLHLWVTHGIFSAGTAELKKRYSHIYCTDSILRAPDGVIRIGVCDRLLEEGHL